MHDIWKRKLQAKRKFQLLRRTTLKYRYQSMYCVLFYFCFMEALLFGIHMRWTIKRRKPLAYTDLS
jgi:hypothetical protein